MTLLIPLTESEERPPLCPLTVWRDFWPLLTTPGTEDELARWSDRGWLDGVLPEWQRQRGPLNTQHQTHDFALDVHSLAVLAGTKHSPYYGGLSERERALTAVAALFHDIAKSGGRPDQQLALIPDWHHPSKGIMVARRRLPQWGLSHREIEWVCRLIRHHQLFGRMIMRYGRQEGPPPAATLSEAATLLLCELVLEMLLPLTEGDIRGVKRDGVLFTPLVAAKLAEFSALVSGRIQAMEAVRGRLVDPAGATDETQRFYLPQTVAHDAYDRCACGWPLQEDQALFWVTPHSELAGDDSLPVQVLPEHCLWTAEAPRRLPLGFRADTLRLGLMGQQPLPDWYQPIEDSRWWLIANPMRLD